MATETVPNIVRGTVPYDDAHACGSLLFDVLTLIHAVDDTIGEDDSTRDFHGLTSPNSRAHCLLSQAMQRTTEAIQKLAI